MMVAFICLFMVYLKNIQRELVRRYRCFTVLSFAWRDLEEPRKHQVT
jgi:hypothetical protein